MGAISASNQAEAAQIHLSVPTLLREGAQALLEPCSVPLAYTVKHGPAAEVSYASEMEAHALGPGEPPSQTRSGTWQAVK